MHYCKGVHCVARFASGARQQSRQHSSLAQHTLSSVYYNDVKVQASDVGERARTVAALSEASCSPSAAAAFLVLRAVLAGCAVPDSAPCTAVLGAFCIQSACQRPPVILNSVAPEHTHESACAPSAVKCGSIICISYTMNSA